MILRVDAGTPPTQTRPPTSVKSEVVSSPAITAPTERVEPQNPDGLDPILSSAIDRLKPYKLMESKPVDKTIPAPKKTVPRAKPIGLPSSFKRTAVMLAGGAFAVTLAVLGAKLSSPTGASNGNTNSPRPEYVPTATPSGSTPFI